MSRADKHFNQTVGWLYSLVAQSMTNRHPYIGYPETIVAAYEAIEFIGDYMGRHDITRLAEPAHVALGDTPAIEDIAWVLGEVQKYRETNPQVSLWRKFAQWWAWLWITKRGYAR